MSDNKADIQDEYQIRHFDFNSTQLVKDFAETVNCVMKSALDGLQNILLGKFSTDEEKTRQEIDRLTELYQDKAKEPLRKFQQTVQEIFTLPPNVFYSDDDGDEIISEEEFEKLTLEVNQLEKTFVEEVYFNAVLRKEIGRYEHVQPFYERTEKILKFYKDNKPGNGEKSVEELMESLQDCYLNYQNSPKENIVDSNMFKVQED